MTIADELAPVRDHLTDEDVSVGEIDTCRHTISQEYPDLPLIWLDAAKIEGEVFLIMSSSL